MPRRPSVPSRALPVLRLLAVPPALGLALALVVSVPAGEAAAGEDCDAGPLFVIERSSNANIVVFEANREETGALHPGKPLTVYWRMFAERGQREELNALEKRLAYGYDVVGEPGPQEALVALHALRTRPVDVRLASGCPAAHIASDGRDMRLRRVFVQLKSRFLIPSVAYVELHGEDAETGSAIEERFEPKK